MNGQRLNDRYPVIHYVRANDYSAEVVDRNSHPMNHGVHDSIRYMVAVVYPNDTTNWVTRYSDGSLGFYHEPSGCAKFVARKAFEFIDTLTEDNEND